MFKRSLCSLSIIGLSLSGCLQDNPRSADPATKAASADTAGPITQALIRGLIAQGFDSAGIVDEGDFLMVDGDMAFRKDEFRDQRSSLLDFEAGTPLAKTAQRRYDYTTCSGIWPFQVCKNYVRSENARLANIKVELDIPGLQADWSAAMAKWNKTGAMVKITQVPVGSSVVDVKITEDGAASRGGSTSWTAYTDYGHDGGVGGRMLIRNTWPNRASNLRIRTFMHELGHAIGMAHTDQTTVSGTYLIRNTPDGAGDPQSIWTSFSQTANNFTHSDLIALRNLFPLNWNQTNAVVGDVNGDGKADLALFDLNGVTVSLANATGTGFLDPVMWSQEFDLRGGWDARCVRTLADVNGDGKADAVGFGYGAVYVALSNGASFNQSTVWSSSFGVNQGWDEKTVKVLADVNGDKKADIIGFGYGNVVVALSNAGHFNAETLWNTDFNYGTGWDGNTFRTVADVTGDGKADIVAFGYGQVIVAPSNGSTFTGAAVWNSQFVYNHGWDNRSVRTVADINGDGKADIVGFHLDDVYTSISNGSSFNSATVASGSYGLNDGFPLASTARLVGDATGDGRADVVAMKGDFYILGQSVSAGSGVFGYTPVLQFK
jgi:hypothetical protein